MQFYSLSAVLLLAVGAVAAAAWPPSVAAWRMQAVVDDGNWLIEPDPPSSEQDVSITYDGDGWDGASYQIDGEDTVDIKIGDGPVVIPKSKLRGKRFIKLRGGDSEEDFVIIRFNKKN